jgi:Beta-lactamase
MTSLNDILEARVRGGAVPGAVALVARGDRIEVEAVGSADVEGTSPMARDSIFRIASITKPIVAAAVIDRFTGYYRTDPAGALELADPPAGQRGHRSLERAGA